MIEGQQQEGPKRFVVSDAEDRALATKEFELVGFYAPGYVGNNGSQEWAEIYHAMSVPPLGAIDALKVAIITDPATRQTGYNPSAVIEFLRQALTPADVPRFNELVDDRTRTVKLTVLADVMLWLAGELTSGNPGAPSSYTSGGASSGPGVPVVSPSPAVPTT